MNQAELEAFVAEFEECPASKFGYLFFFVGDDHRVHLYDPESDQTSTTC